MTLPLCYARSTEGSRGARVHYMDGEIVRIIVPTENGEDCYIEFRRNWKRWTWIVEVSDGLIRHAPEAIHAALGLALMELKAVTPCD